MRPVINGLRILPEHMQVSNTWSKTAGILAELGVGGSQIPDYLKNHICNLLNSKAYKVLSLLA